MAPWIKRLHSDQQSKPSTRTSVQQAAEPSQCYLGHQTESIHSCRPLITPLWLWNLDRIQAALETAWKVPSTCLHSILGIRWQERVTNTEVYERTNCISVDAMLLKSCLRWTGHVIKMENHRTPKRLLFGELERGHKKQGHPCKCFKDTVKAGLK